MAYAAKGGGLVDNAVLVAIMLMSTSLILAGAALVRLGNLRWLSAVLRRMEDTSSQLRIRVAMTLALAFAVAASNFGLSMILGAFMAGVILRLIGRHEPEVQPPFRLKLDAIGNGFLIPIFFVTTGIGFDVDALFRSVGTVLRIPLFLAAIILVGGLPVLFYRGLVDRTQARAAVLLQSTTLTVIIVAVAIGLDAGQLRPGNAAALLAAGLPSVVAFPPLALGLLGRRPVPAVGAPGEAG